MGRQVPQVEEILDAYGYRELGESGEDLLYEAWREFLRATKQAPEAVEGSDFLDWFLSTQQGEGAADAEAGAPAAARRRQCRRQLQCITRQCWTCQGTNA